MRVITYVCEGYYVYAHEGYIYESYYICYVEVNVVYNDTRLY